MQAYDYELGADCDYDYCRVQSEHSRPMPITILHQQGIHPHPGPDGMALSSIMDDECWDQWGITEYGSRGEGVTGTLCYRESLPLHVDRTSVHDLTVNDDESNESHDEQGEEDGFTDWYGDKSSIDRPCRGRNERVLGTEWIDEVAYFGPPPSLLQAALGSGAASSDNDPSCRKLCRKQTEHPVDELHQTWVDELSLSTSSTCPAGCCGSWEVTSMFVSHALPGTPNCDYGMVDVYGSGNDDGTDDYTSSLVGKFLGRGKLAAEAVATAAENSAENSSRNSLLVRVCARFRAAASGSRPGEQDLGSESQARFWAAAHGGRPKEEDEDDDEDADEEAKAAEKGTGPTGYRWGGGGGRQVQRQYASSWHPPFAPFFPYPHPAKQNQNPSRHQPYRPPFCVSTGC